MTGTGGLTKAGPSQLTLGGTASNTYTGTTTVTSGVLRLAKTSNAQAISGPLVVNGGAVFTDQLNQIVDTVPVTVNAPGAFSMVGLAGRSKHIGSLAGNGTVTLTNHTLSVGFNNQSTVFTGTIGGTNAFLSKWGTGTLTLTGINYGAAARPPGRRRRTDRERQPAQQGLRQCRSGRRNRLRRRDRRVDRLRLRSRLAPAPGGAGTGILSTSTVDARRRHDIRGGLERSHGWNRLRSPRRLHPDRRSATRRSWSRAATRRRRTPRSPSSTTPAPLR